MRTALVSMGSPLKADDDVANLVLDRLREREGLLKVRAGPSPENFIKPVRQFRPDAIVFLDAVDFKGEAGEVRLFGLRDLAEIMVTTTHDIPIGTIGQFFQGVKVMVIGIQPKDISYGTGLSRELEARLPDITMGVEGLLARM